MGSSRNRIDRHDAQRETKTSDVPRELQQQSWRRVANDGSERPSFVRAPSLLVLNDFDGLARRVGHENAGFLSVAHGFMPRAPPLARLSAPFSPWDELALELPALHRTLKLRKYVEQLPLLDASQKNLGANELLRACALLAIVSHAYWYVEPAVPQQLPEALRRPWAQLRQRLGRTEEVLTYIDLVVYNWRLVDAARADPLVVENLELLFPTIGNREERVFYLTQLEILSRATPIVSHVAAAQDAVLRQEDRAVEAALDGIIGCLSAIVRRTLLKLDPHPHSSTYVDPVVWAKTVAPLAVPFRAGIQGPSGTSSPLFNTLDLFFGRKRYESFLGREIKQLRATYPRAWQSFLGALTQVSVGDYVQRSDNRALSEAWSEALDLYAGQTGFLGRHRMKVYGFLELAFKVGRSVTIGGFGGMFKDRTWDLVDNELVAAQAERPRQSPDRVQWAKVIEVDDGADGPNARVGRVALDVSTLSLRYRPGDRCLVLPENDGKAITRTLTALQAQGDELVALTDEWRAQLDLRGEPAESSHLPLREVLRFGSIRPVSPRLAEALHAHSQSPSLLRTIMDEQTEALELWELLGQLALGGFDPRSLWCDAQGAPSERLCRLIPPMRFRIYSISSVAHDARGEPNPRLELTVSLLRYAGTPAPDGDPVRRGTASAFLVEALRHDRAVPFLIERPDRFLLPEDPTLPVLMFAGGSGVSPFRAFLRARSRGPVGARDWLFLSLRSPSELLYADELKPAMQRGSLELSLAFTREGAQLLEDGALVAAPTTRIEELMREPGTAARLCQLLLPKSEGGAGAHVYVCGRGGFAQTVLASLKHAFRSGLAHLPQPEEAAALLLHRLSGEGRLVQEIHTDMQPRPSEMRRFPMSEVAEHNNKERGYWMAIEGSVYDLTEFMDLHPGGRRIVQAYAGMDASHGFLRAHGQRADVDAMREMYRIGLVQAHSFEEHAVQVAGPHGPLTVDCTTLHRALLGAVQLVVEMQNALAADQSLQGAQVGDEPSPALRTPYKQARALETHHRFLGSYLSVLVGETLPSFWRLGCALLFPDESAEYMERQLSSASEAEDVQRAHAFLRAMAEQLEPWLGDPRGDTILRLLESSDARFLADMKATLLTALRELERAGTRLRAEGAMPVLTACRRAAQLVQDYHRDLASVLTMEAAHPREASRAGTLNPPQQHARIRLHAGRYWLLEEEPARQLAILQRTPVPLSSLAELGEEIEQILACLSAKHRSYGLVVDTRRAPLRNDAAFEDSTARLRSGLTGHFLRTAVLLESSLGTLQVERLERDEGRASLVTRSESSAFKFALGGS